LDAETCRGFNEHNKLLTTPLSISWFLSPKHLGLFRTLYINSYVLTILLQRLKLRTCNCKLNSTTINDDKSRIRTVLAVNCLGLPITPSFSYRLGATRIPTYKIFKYKSGALSLEVILIFSCRYSTSLRAGRSCVRTLVETRFPGPPQTDLAAHSSSCRGSAGLLRDRAAEAWY
jgi:hypothetical protein